MSGVITPVMVSSGNGSVQTAATGTNYTALTAQACMQVTIVNDTGTKLEVRQDGAGTALKLLDQDKYTFYGLANASQLSVRRVDTSNTQVTATYRWEG